MNPTIPSRTTAQIVLSTATAVLVVLGAAALLSGLGLLRRRGRPRPDKISLAKAGAGLLMLVAGAFTYVAGLAAPALPEIISATRFSSDAAPALSIDMPAGWTLEHDRAAGRLTASDGSRSTLFIETSRVSDGIDPPRFLKMLAESARATRGAAGEPFEESIDGLRASGLSTTVADEANTFWYVPRGGPVVTVIRCGTTTPSDSTKACKEALLTLRWRAIGPL